MKNIKRDLELTLVRSRLLIAQFNLTKAIRRLESASSEASHHKGEVERLAKDIDYLLSS